MKSQHEKIAPSVLPYVVRKNHIFSICAKSSHRKRFVYKRARDLLQQTNHVAKFQPFRPMGLDVRSPDCFPRGSSRPGNGGPGGRIEFCQSVSHRCPVHGTSGRFPYFYIFCCRFGTDRTFGPKFCGHLREDVCYAGRSSAKVKMGQKCTSVAPVHTESTFFGKIGNVSFSLSGNRGYPKVVKKDSGGATLGHIEVPT